MKTIVTLLVFLISFAGAYFFYFQGDFDPIKTPLDIDSIEGTPQKETEVKVLSEDANFPTPVIELQQTLSHGIQHLDAPELPLVHEDLKEFAEQNMTQDIPIPEELIKLNQELDRLQALVGAPQN